MAFELPKLPYEYDALQDLGMSKETLNFHHDFHHKAYVDNGNKLLEGSGHEEKSLENINDGYKAAFLMRIQFLESKGRHEFFKKFPPKFVYVFSSRIRIFKNNDQVKYSGGQPLCYAWLIWEKGFAGETTLRWIK